MPECEDCKTLQNELDALQEKYDALYKKVDESCFDIKRSIEDMTSEL